VRVRIHRGAVEIGGNCVELEAQGQRLLLDLGRPLWSEPGDDLPLPPVAGLGDGRDPSLLGVVISHGHPDHYGLAGLLPEGVSLYMGVATARILKEATYFTPMGLDREPTGKLVDRESLRIGPFTVMPYLVDHSAFDAYALLVEAGGRRLFYSADLRAHGRKAVLFERLLDHPPEGIDVLLLEGTRVGRLAQDAGSQASEAEIEEQCVELFEQTEGLVLVAFSVQNIDRVVTLYKAALRADRDLLLDLYGAAVTSATGNPNIPQPGWERVRFFVPQSQRLRVKQSGQFERVRLIRHERLFAEDLADLRSRLVLSFRPSMTRDLERAECLAGARAIWSMWSGYLVEPRMEVFHDFLERHQIPMVQLHAAGHAPVADLQRLATAIDAERTVPIHTTAPEMFADALGGAELHQDGEWWEV
jgi:ribonuclease J